MISFIIPAYNEEALLGETLDAINLAAAPIGQPYEVIVVDDGSTDRTAAIAAERGARVVTVRLRHIAAARNAGARTARGELLVFVDADTIMPGIVLAAALQAIEAGAVGGGAGALQDTDDPRWGRAALCMASWIMRQLKWAAGCFFFVRRDIFERVGGFDERYFASEEIHLSRAVKKHGRFVILRGKVITSGRKGRLFGGRAIFVQFAAALWPSTLKRRERLGLWYDGQREKGRQ
ncbi:MAG TPA: glycosyltransferase [Vicinamibacterales bacterium]|nr:glycosyltransferase [Vicinamibacterales bacterium]